MCNAHNIEKGSLNLFPLWMLLSKGWHFLSSSCIKQFLFVHYIRVALFNHFPKKIIFIKEKCAFWLSCLLNYFCLYVSYLVKFTDFGCRIGWDHPCLVPLSSYIGWCPLSPFSHTDTDTLAHAHLWGCAHAPFVHVVAGEIIFIIILINDVNWELFYAKDC